MERAGGKAIEAVTSSQEVGLHCVVSAGRARFLSKAAVCKSTSSKIKGMKPEPLTLHFNKTMHDLDVLCVLDPERFLAHPEMLDLAYLESSSLDGNTICQRIKVLRKGDTSRGYEDQGVIYWQHIMDQQKALAKLGDKLAAAPSDIIFTMEWGGTQLYDFLLPYIPEGDRPSASVSLLKDTSVHTGTRINRMVERVYKACEKGFEQLGIVEVSISGTQLAKISASLQERFKHYSGEPVQLNLYILKQSLSINRGGNTPNKEHKPVAVNDDVTIVFHIVETPFLMGEDVDQYLCYGHDNQHPLNLVLPDGSLWQLRSPEGTRGTL